MNERRTAVVHVRGIEITVPDAVTVRRSGNLFEVRSAERALGVPDQPWHSDKTVLDTVQEAIAWVAAKRRATEG